MTKTNHWASKSLTVILPYLTSLRTMIESGELREARKVVRDLYPFGERRYWPYREWCAVIRIYLPGLCAGRKPKESGGWFEATDQGTKRSEGEEPGARA